MDAADPVAAALEVFLREVVRMPEDELEGFRALPVWQVRVLLAPTTPRELAVDRSYRFRPERFAAFVIPTLALVNADSPPIFRQPAGMLVAALPRSRLVVMPGQRHVAMDTTPELFLAEVSRFLERPAGERPGAAK